MHKKNDEEEHDEVSGRLITTFDCPECEEITEVEGDATGDTVNCDACGHTVIISNVK